MSEPFAFLLGIPLFLIFFAILWNGIVFLTSVLFGWQSLAGRYRADHVPDIPMRRFQSARLRFGNYSGILNVGSTSTDLYLSVLFLYRIGHPPLKIPLSDITAHETHLFLWRVVKLEFESVPSVKLQLYKRTADYLVERSGGHFKYERLD